MKRQELYTLIDRYIQGALSGSELEQFEDRLRADKELAEEVELHRRVHRELTDRAKQEFREKVEQVVKEKRSQNDPVPDKPKKPGYKFWFLAIILLGIAGVVGIWIGKMPEKSATKTEDTSTSAEIPAQRIDSTETSIPSGPPETKPTQEPEEKPSKDLNTTDPPADREKQNGNKNRPIAQIHLDDLKENEYLEDLIKGSFRSGNYRFELSPPWNAAVRLYPENGKTSLSLNGQIERPTSEIVEKLTFNLYSNKEEDYLNEQPLLQLPVELKPAEDSTFFFAINRSLILSPGLYYYIFSTDDEELLVGKFIVEVD